MTRARCLRDYGFVAVPSLSRRSTGLILFASNKRKPYRRVAGAAYRSAGFEVELDPQHVPLDRTVKLRLILRKLVIDPLEDLPVR